MGISCNRYPNYSLKHLHVNFCATNAPQDAWASEADGLYSSKVYVVFLMIVSVLFHRSSHKKKRPLEKKRSRERHFAPFFFSPFFLSSFEKPPPANRTEGSAEMPSLCESFLHASHRRLSTMGAGKKESRFNMKNGRNRRAVTDRFRLHLNGDISVRYLAFRDS